MNTKNAARISVSGLSFWADKEFTYSYPEELREKIFPGAKVIVPFGRGGRKREGIVTELCEHDGSIPLKSVIKAESDETFVSGDGIEHARYMAKRYYAPLYDCLSLMTIPGTGAKFKSFYVLGETAENELSSAPSLRSEILSFIKGKGRVTFSELSEKFPVRGFKVSFDSLLKSKAVTLFEEISERGGKMLQTVYLTQDRSKIDEFINAYAGKAKAQIRLLEALIDGDGIPVTELVAISGSTRASVKALFEKGLIEIRSEPAKTELFSEEKMIASKKPELTDEQKDAVSTVLKGREKGEFSEYLIKGVTGSGKTEIYLTLCETVVKEGKQAIILVPEISLTPQIRARFFGRFGDNVAVLHSALSVSERRAEWRKIKNNEVSVVVGARSAVFAPFSDLSMIIIDEEHETSYKSEMSPRYDAKEIAAFRMKKNKGTLVLASATPSVSSFYKTQVGESTLITLKKRYNDVPLPNVEIIDLRNEIKSGNRGILSDCLKNALYENRKKGGKSILLLNRRGYSTFISCRDCGYTVKCPKCEIAMTYHSVENRLKCHYCQTSLPVPSVCPECGSNSIRYFGSGTQKLEEELYRIFPDSAVIRMDNDTTTAKMSHERLLKRFEAEKGSILVGTQMIAKGLDFKDVSVVGVVSADSTLFVGGYLGSEKTFSLITQVCGRSGRGETQGNAIVQTYQPEHYSIKAAKTQDYDKFYENEIIFRKNVKYPPFCEIINIVFTGESEEGILEFAEGIKPLMTEAVALYNERKNYIAMYGPVPCSISKIKNKYRFHITVKCKSADSVRSSLSYAMGKLMQKAPSGVSAYVDVNPISFL